MKRIHIITLLILFPLSTLFAQVYEPLAPDADSLELNDQRIRDLNSGKAVVEESTVMEMLDMVSSIGMTKDVYLDIDKKAWNKYGF